MEVNIHEAKTHLSRLIERALAGEEVVIAKSGHPLVRLVRIERPKPELGSARGAFKLKKGWDAPLSEGEVEARHSMELFRLPLIHKDLFDRLLVAQARADAMTIVSRDEEIAKYGVPVLW
jgi:prevent-host-death family protein